MAKYFQVTEKELMALMEVSDSMWSMAGCADEEFNAEAKKGVRAIDAILKRAGLKRVTRKRESLSVPNIN